MQKLKQEKHVYFKAITYSARIEEFVLPPRAVSMEKLCYHFFSRNCGFRDLPASSQIIQEEHICPPFCFSLLSDWQDPEMAAVIHIFLISIKKATDSFEQLHVLISATLRKQIHVLAELFQSTFKLTLSRALHIFLLCLFGFYLILWSNQSLLSWNPAHMAFRSIFSCAKKFFF